MINTRADAVSRATTVRECFPARAAGLAALAGLLVAAGPASAAPYHDYAALADKLCTLASSFPDACELTTLGVSRQGRDLVVLRLGRGADVAERPALALVAGVDGDDPAGSETAAAVAERLLAAAEGQPGHDLLARYAVYVIPRVNPDAMEAYFAPVKMEQRAALRPVDDDRDGAIDEDGPEDLNGDGWITQMRVIDPDKATHLPDPVEPRLLKPADRAVGEMPLYRVLIEGIDNDGDEEFNEDGPGGVEINRNFPHGYKEHQPGAGPHMISEPESKALIDFFLSHPRIAAVIVYGRHDNVVKTPEGGKTDDTKRAPVGLHKDDVDIYKHLGEKYREITGIKTTPAEADDGAVFAWAYAQYGVPAFACRVWPRPEADKEKGKEKAKDGEQPEEQAAEQPETPPSDEGGQRPGGRMRGARPPGAVPPPPPAGEPPATEPPRADDPHKAPPDVLPPDALPPDGAMEPEQRPPDHPPDGPGGDRPAGRAAERADQDGKEGGKKDDKKKEPADKEAAAWLKYSDDRRGGAGFLAWTAFDHPQLGPVEIGGFVPFFQAAPPAEELDAIADKQLAFAVEVLTLLPSVTLAEPTVKQLSPAVFEIETALVNAGYFPSGLAIAQQNRRVRPIVITLDLPLDRILGGQRVERFWSVPGGAGRGKLRWVIVGEPGGAIPISMASDKYGDRSLVVTLPAPPPPLPPPPMEPAPENANDNATPPPAKEGGERP